MAFIVSLALPLQSGVQDPQAKETTNLWTARVIKSSKLITVSLFNALSSRGSAEVVPASTGQQWVHVILELKTRGEDYDLTLDGIIMLTDSSDVHELRGICLTVSDPMTCFKIQGFKSLHLSKNPVQRGFLFLAPLSAKRLDLRVKDGPRMPLTLDASDVSVVKDAGGQTTTSPPAAGNAAFVRVADALLLTEPPGGNQGQGSIRKIPFGEPVTILERHAWVRVKHPKSGATGWLHSALITSSEAEVATIRKSKQIPSVVYYIDLKEGTTMILSGSYNPSQQKEGWLGALEVGQAVLLSGIEDLPARGEINIMNCKLDRTARSNVIYYMATSTKCVAWPPGS